MSRFTSNNNTPSNKKGECLDYVVAEGEWREPVATIERLIYEVWYRFIGIDMMVSQQLLARRNTPTYVRISLHIRLRM